MVEMLHSSSGRFHLNSHRRFLPWIRSYPVTLLTVLWVIGFGSIFIWQTTSITGSRIAGGRPMMSYAPIPMLRPVAFNLTEFGGVGDGVTANTAAFERAVDEIARLGGGQLNVQPGVWLTAPFNLTSHMTLFLAEGAVIRGVQILTCNFMLGRNGTIDGQGQSWWSKYKQKLLKYTRGPLVQIMWSRDIVISNITLRDSPFWTLHPYDCKNVTISNLTILAPLNGAPNTDGIDPDSCEDMVIENCYICVGDDGIAIKSGWDQYGIVYGRPSTNILIRNVTVRSVVSAGVSIGSEMSGGISNITVENVHIWDSRRGVRIKTAPGRGGYVSNITYRNITLDNVRVGIVLKTDYNEHPDLGFDPKALPTIKNLSFIGFHGQGCRVPVRIHGSQEIPVKGVTFKEFSVGITYKKKHIFQCSYVDGRVIGSIFPAPCENLDRYDEEGNLVRRSKLQNVTDIDYDF
ncbi:uncharacterized protein A4U43_C06F3860 [Asparagus officinalis]|uniref:Pectate lyase superfamily protein domain-containing protein n=1 Tax=Asparagus officinalis TaxID=4686 RepID=A0A5P1END0_ASPOF|nr:uncharacterized protein A4U43_C06F3860 [Asparagus officinalis]